MLKNFKLIIGLGNPDKNYESTYHNIGFLAIDYLKKNLAGTEKIRLKSSAYMNQSGRFVKKTLKDKKAKPEELLVIHDDSDLVLGKYKLSFGRGSAGHKGAQSVIDALGTKGFWRLRIGIRETDENKREKAGAIVLQKIKKEDLSLLKNVFAEIANHGIAS